MLDCMDPLLSKPVAVDSTCARNELPPLMIELTIDSRFTGVGIEVAAAGAVGCLFDTIATELSTYGAMTLFLPAVDGVVDKGAATVIVKLAGAAAEVIRVLWPIEAESKNDPYEVEVAVINDTIGS